MRQCTRTARWLATLFGLATAIVVVSGCTADAAQRDTTNSIGAGLEGPAGFSASVIAQGLPNVAALAFDANGRLWAATAAFTDTGNDGVFVVQPGAAPQQVLSGLHTPLGLLWAGDTLYVAMSGGVRAYSGFDGSAFATERQVLTLPDDVGEVNELAMGLDGRLRLGVSAPCDHCQPASQWSAAVLSFEPDGSDLRVEASGIRAPVGLAYLPGTDQLFVTMNQRDDLGDATPGDWLAVVHAGQDWGFPDCYGQGGDSCAEAPTPVAVLDAHAAVSGVAFVQGQRGVTALVAEWALGNVMVIAVTQGGASTAATVTGAITGFKSPVAVTAAPDGSAYVGDWGTGTIYRIAA